MMQTPELETKGRGVPVIGSIIRVAERLKNPWRKSTTASPSIVSPVKSGARKCRKATHIK